ncbi:MAG: ATP-binding protein [Myxococcota bacterium]
MPEPDASAQLSVPRTTLDSLARSSTRAETFRALAAEAERLCPGVRAVVLTIQGDQLIPAPGFSGPPVAAKDEGAALETHPTYAGLGAPLRAPIRAPGTPLLGVLAAFASDQAGIERHRRLLEDLAMLTAILLRSGTRNTGTEPSEHQLRHVLESVKAVVCTFDCQGVYSFVSPNWTEITGHSPEATLGHHYAELVHPDDVGAFREFFGRVIDAHTEQVGFEYRVRYADKSVAWHTANAAPMWDVTGKISGAVSVIREITDKKKLEAQLILADRMVSVGTLAAGVAHEINNPLSYVLGNLSFVAERLRVIRDEAPDLKEEMSELERATSDALDGAHRVKGIVMDLKTFSRTDEQSWGSVDVVNALEFAVRMTQNEMRHRARLVRSYSPVPKIVANEARLGQVFVNLLINAIQALPEESTEHNEIRLAVYLRDPDTIAAEVKDSGLGVPPEIQSRIFDPFFTTKPAGVGTGLGLSICHGIVASIGGKIELESTPGEGALFRVCLPTKTAQGS